MRNWQENKENGVHFVHRKWRKFWKKSQLMRQRRWVEYVHGALWNWWLIIIPAFPEVARKIVTFYTGWIHLKTNEAFSGRCYKCSKVSINQVNRKYWALEWLFLLNPKAHFLISRKPGTVPCLYWKDMNMVLVSNICFGTCIETNDFRHILVNI